MRLSRPLPSVFGSVLALLLLLGCGKKQEADMDTKQMDEALATVVAGYSGGMISADGPVVVTFVNPSADSASLGKPLKKNPFDFSPSLKGTVVWSDEKTLEFRPAQRLERGKQYHATLKLDQVMAVPENIIDFKFQFTAMHQHLETDMGGLEMMNEDKLEWQPRPGALGASAEPPRTSLHHRQPTPGRKGFGGLSAMGRPFRRHRPPLG